MTVLSELSKIAYIGDSSQTLYPIPFEYINVDNIYVSIYTNNNEFVENWTYSNQYIIENSNVKVLSGFEIDNTKKLLIIRVIDAVQDNRYREGGDFPAKSTETSFDKLTMLIQQHQEVLDRCVKVEVLDNQTPEELLAEVYSKLDSATDVANDAIAAAEQATVATEQATTAVEEAKKQIIASQEYVDAAKLDINNTVNAGKEDINKSIDEAQMDLSDTINQAVKDVKQEAIKAADETIQATIGGSVDEAANYAKESKAWARGEDADVEEFAPGENEHSSRGYADLAMAIANTPEDVPVDTSTLLALEIIKGPKGDSGEAEFSGDVTFTGTFDVHSDSNHPVKVTGMAGTSASGFQIVDSNGLGDSDFEHYATGDRYGTRITNHNNTSNTSVSVDLYQSNVGKSILDATNVDTVLVKELQVDGKEVATTDSVTTLLGTLYPVGSIYITTTATCPLAGLGVGTWELVAKDRVLQGAGTRGAVGTTINESLPNITGYIQDNNQYADKTSASGAFIRESISYSTYIGTSNQTGDYTKYTFDASRSSSTYKNGAPVQPDAYLVNIFRRIQ